MIEAFKISDNQIKLIKIQDEKSLKKAIWIDINEPSIKEMDLISKISSLPVPSLEEIQEIESSSHYKSYDKGFQLNCLFLQLIGRDDNSNANVLFLVNQDRVITICQDEVPELRLLRKYFKKNVLKLLTPKEIFIQLMEMKIDRVADTLEDSYKRLNKIGKNVLSVESNNTEDAMEDLAQEDDTLGMVRLCLMDTQRDMLILQKRKSRWLDEEKEEISDILIDIDTLMPHNTFLSEKTDFLMNAAQGFINIQQNKIIKIFSIASVVFLPPTMIASIYGMNFRFMPELHWEAGYPFALALIAISGVAPYLFF
ncbi:MAG: magnesium/cobalt transporter CorA, partial [Campylobacteraceae bacterium]|nr:magnesium/cobalt transporter CorA [Campylobacteraceae bacterium]